MTIRFQPEILEIIKDEMQLLRFKTISKCVQHIIRQYRKVCKERNELQRKNRELATRNKQLERLLEAVRFAVADADAPPPFEIPI